MVQKQVKIVKFLNGAHVLCCPIKLACFCLFVLTSCVFSSCFRILAAIFVSDYFLKFYGCWSPVGMVFEIQNGRACVDVSFRQKSSQTY